MKIFSKIISEIAFSFVPCLVLLRMAQILKMLIMITRLFPHDDFLFVFITGYLKAE